ncbi:MAG TPA: PIG-L family deacetylase [Candidatus Nanoarchaeia archaeon]
MISVENKTLLVVAAHPDDEVLGCGGLISKIKEAGGKVFILFLTNGTTKDFSARGVSTEVEREEEIKKVAKSLHFDGYRIAFPGDDYHLKLDQVPQKQIIHEIERGEKISLETTKPDIIALPFFGDYNQDHSATAKAAFSACRPSLRTKKFVPDLILAYEEPTDSWSLEPQTKLNFFIELDEREVDGKMKALSLYQSQVRGKGHPRNLQVLKSLAVIRGSMIGAAFAEGFYCHKLRA